MSREVVPPYSKSYMFVLDKNNSMVKDIDVIDLPFQ